MLDIIDMADIVDIYIGNWCPEYDTFEGNDQTMSVAIHTCDYVPDNEYSRSLVLSTEYPEYWEYSQLCDHEYCCSCDRSGCGTNACEGIGGQYGRGRAIDTARPYRISHGQARTRAT